MRSNPNSETAKVATAIETTKRRHRSKLERRRIAEETFVPGNSVAVIARSHGVNANQVFHWRKLYREGRLDLQQPATQFLPASIIESGQIEERGAEARSHSDYTGAIDIEIRGARVRITGSADPGCIRVVLEQLGR